MCGRTYYNIDLDLLQKKFNCKKIIDNKDLKKGIINKNNYSPIIFQKRADANETDEKQNVLCICSWGINPAPFKHMDTKIVLINARFETLTSKKTFSALIGKNRCAIVVNGFFEWKNVETDDAEESKKKVPYFIFCKTGFSLLDEADVKEENTEVKKEENDENQIDIKEENKEVETKKENAVVEEEGKEKEGTSDDEPLSKIEEKLAQENDETKRKGKRKLEEINVAESETKEEEGKEEEKGEEGEEEETYEAETKRVKKEQPERDMEQFKTCMLLAGLYTVDKKADVYKYTIITTGSETEFLQDIHERCPLFLSEKSLSLWINPDNKFSDIKKQIREEHITVCNNLSKVSVTSWSTYVVSSSNNSKNSIRRYIKN